MLSILTKTTPWMVASLLVAASSFGNQNNRGCPTFKPKPQCCEPVKCEKVCPPVCPVCLTPAYNQSAEIDVRCGWDVWVDASFTYWQAIQDNMEVGITNAQSVAPAAGSSASFVANGHVIDMDFDYQPGFKVGLGIKFDYDNWDAHAEYTWFRGDNSMSAKAPHTTAANPFAQVFPITGSPFLNGDEMYTTVSASWDLDMDIVDAVLGRWYYVGTKLTFHPYVGARAQWIRQYSKVRYVNTNTVTSGDNLQTHTINKKSNSWAIGPEVGIDLNWMLGYGLRFFTCGEADILYTRYTKVSVKEFFIDTTTPSNTPPGPFHVSQIDIGRLRTHFDLEMGLGWGTFLDCNAWYLDLSAAYGFQVFFDQNMFRKFVDSSMAGASFLSSGNLYIHGLTATVSLDF